MNGFNRFSIVTFVIVLTSIFAFACGGSSDSGSKPSTSSSNQQNEAQPLATVPPPVATPQPASPTPLPYPVCKSLPPLPESAVKITPPSAAIPPNVAAFSGAWEGDWNVGGHSHLIVQSISAVELTSVFALGNGVSLNLYQVQPDGSVKNNNPAVGGWTMASDLKSIQGTSTRNNQTFSVTMTRCTALPAPTPSTPAGQQYPTCVLLPQVQAQDLQVTPPAPGTPANLAALSGVWEGFWGEPPLSASDFVVKSISATEVGVTYVFVGAVQPGSNNFRPDPTDGSIRASAGGVTFSWILSPDGRILMGTRSQGGFTSTVKMMRCIPK